MLYWQKFWKHLFSGTFYVLISVFIFALPALADNENKDVFISGKTPPVIDVVATIDNQTEAKGISKVDLADFSIFLGIWSKFAESINLINK